MTSTKKEGHGSVTFVLGAGASRSVSYARNTDVPSPLDRDFFDLLQRLEPQEKDEAAVGWVVEKMLTLPFEYRRSLERAFYTLHLRSYLRRKLTSAVEKTEEEAVVSHFARALVALLRKAHGVRTCENHEYLLQGLGRNDAVITFNYDLVAERALRGHAEVNEVPFVPGIYRLKPDDQPDFEFPKILKLHGSVNWRMEGDAFHVRTTDWGNFDDTPGYRGYSGEGTRFPIFLPFWDKQVTRGPWLPLWQKAHQQLKKTEYIVVWGFSMATTDVKARELFTISVPDGGANRRLCVIDPSQATRDRWRELLPYAQYWEYDNIKGFQAAPPPWWWGEAF
jgi:SIR2-like protein